MAADATVVFPESGSDALMTLLQTALVNSKMRLCKSAVPADPGTLVADLVAIEADYTGYLAKTMAAWTGPYHHGIGQSSILSPMEVFAPTGSAITNSIYGGWIEEAGGTLVAIFQLATPKALLDTTDFLALIAELSDPEASAVHQLD